MNLSLSSVSQMQPISFSPDEYTVYLLSTINVISKGEQHLFLQLVQKQACVLFLIFPLQFPLESTSLASNEREKFSHFTAQITVPVGQILI